MNKEIIVGDISVKRIGLGTNRLTDTNENHELLKHAVKAGLGFIDTANIYTGGNSETTIGNTLSPFSENLIVATKGGMVRGNPANNKPAYLRECLEESLKRLKTDCIYLYQIHRLDPDVPVEDTMGLLKDLQKEGKIRFAGLSEVSVENIKRAVTVMKPVSVQNHYNLSIRKHEEVVDFCTENNIVFIPFFPLDNNRIAETKVQSLTSKYKCSPHQLTLAWLLKRSELMLPIPGTLSIKHLDENLSSLDIEIDEHDYQTLLSI